MKYTKEHCRTRKKQYKDLITENLELGQEDKKHNRTTRHQDVVGQETTIHKKRNKILGKETTILGQEITILGQETTIMGYETTIMGQ